MAVNSEWETETVYNDLHHLKKMAWRVSFDFGQLKQHEEVRSSSILIVPSGSNHVVEWTVLVKPRVKLDDTSKATSVSIHILCQSKQPINMSGVLQASLGGKKCFKKEILVHCGRKKEFHQYGWNEFITSKRLHFPKSKLMLQGNTKSLLEVSLVFAKGCQFAKATRLSFTGNAGTEYVDKDLFLLTTADGGSEFINKKLLASQSDFFDGMFRHETMKEVVAGSCVLTGADREQLATLVRYLKFGHIYDFNDSTQDDLYYLADFYGIPVLKDLITNFMKNNVTTANLGDILVLADIYEDKELKSACRAFMTLNRTMIVKPSYLASLLKVTADHDRLHLNVLALIMRPPPLAVPVRAKRKFVEVS